MLSQVAEVRCRWCIQKGAICGVSHLANGSLVYSKEGVHGQKLKHFCFYRSWSRLDVGHAAQLINRELPFLINVLHNNSASPLSAYVVGPGKLRAHAAITSLLRQHLMACMVATVQM